MSMCCSDFPRMFVSMQILKLSQVTIGKLSVGHIVNLASNDVQRFDLVRQSMLDTTMYMWCIQIGLWISSIYCDQPHSSHCIYIPCIF